MTVPAPITSQYSRVCHRRIPQGAKLGQTVEDALSELSPMYRDALVREAPGTSPGPSGPVPTDRPVQGLTPDEAAVLSLFDDPRPVHVDRLAENATFGVARLQAALFALALRGCIDPLPGGYYVARPRTGADGARSGQS